MIADELKQIETTLCEISDQYESIAEALSLAQTKIEELSPIIESMRTLALETKNESPHGQQALNHIATTDEMLKLIRNDFEQADNNTKYIGAALDGFGQFFSCVVDQREAEDVEPL